MPRLSDTQRILLAHAAQHGSGSLYPLPASVDGDAERAAKAVTALLKRGFVAEAETSDATAVHRVDGDLRYGAFITAAGLAAIGIEPEADDGVAGDGAIADAPASTPRTSKIAGVLALLGRDDGATAAELIVATGWLPHTTRAALTGLRKKGHAIVRGSREGTTCYRIAVAA